MKIEGKILVLLLFLALVLRLVLLWKISAPITYDQGRDLLDLRAMMVENKLGLIGPTTSLHGVFSGPWWYWLSLPFYLLTAGSPYATVLMMIFLSILILGLFYFLVKDKIFALIWVALAGFSHAYVYASLIGLNTNPMYLFLPLMLIFWVRGNLGWAIFCWSLFFSFEAIVGIILMPLILELLFWRRKTAWQRKLVFFGFLPLMPSLLFEIRHGFGQLKTIWRLVVLRESSLTDLPDSSFWLRLGERGKAFLDSFVYVGGQSRFLAFLLGGILIYYFWLIFRNKEKNFNTALGKKVLVVLCLLFTGFVVYPYALWSWYFGAIEALWLMLMTLALVFLIKSKNIYWSRLGWAVFLILFFKNLSFLNPLPIRKEIRDDPANLRVRLAVIDKIYRESAGRGMGVYTFAPYVYDYPYQYLIWWRAKTEYGYRPEKYYYLDNQPAYVPVKQGADAIIPTKRAEATYLIIEPHESQKGWYDQWRSNFGQACQNWEIGRTRLEKLCE